MNKIRALSLNDLFEVIHIPAHYTDPYLELDLESELQKEDIEDEWDFSDIERWEDHELGPMARHMVWAETLTIMFRFKDSD